MNQKFKTGDVCICNFSLKKRNGRFWDKKKDCRVRIIKPIYSNLNGWVYSTYNIDFNRYEKIGEMYLKIDLQYIRDKKLNEILN